MFLTYMHALAICIFLPVFPTYVITFVMIEQKIYRHLSQVLQYPVPFLDKQRSKEYRANIGVLIVSIFHGITPTISGI